MGLTGTLAWLMFGLLCAVGVRLQTGPLPRNRKWQPVFFATIVLLGPLNLLILLVPTKTIDHLTRKDRQDVHI